MRHIWTFAASFSLGARHHLKRRVPAIVLQDLMWWSSLLPQFNRIRYFDDSARHTFELYTDASLIGLGGFFFEGEGSWKIKIPLIFQVNAFATTVPNAEQVYINNRISNLKYFIRGVISNEDPETLLYDEKAANNLTYSAGFDWGGKFKLVAMFGYGKEELICRLHSGDLQWFRTMGSMVGEPPSETKQNIVRWMDIMYNVATGALYAKTRIRDTWLGSFFDNSSKYNTIGSFYIGGVDLEPISRIKHWAPAFMSYRIRMLSVIRTVSL